MSSMPKLVIFGDPKKAPVAKAIEEFKAFVKGKATILATYTIEDFREGAPEDQESPYAQEEASILKKCDYAIVFGGDGSIISTARKLRRASLPVIGVNLGKLGFLAEFSIDELKEYFGNVISGRTQIEKRMV